MLLSSAFSLALSVRRLLLRRLAQSQLAYYKRRGVQIGENFTCVGVPHFGSEPYLISIGNNVSISGSVRFLTHDAVPWHLHKLGLIGETIRYGRITVHDDSGIGYGALILPGVSIGPRSIVGAGAVVRRDVPPNTLVVGNPARVAMTIDEYIRLVERTNVIYDKEAYARDPVAEILRLFPRPW